MAVFVLLFCIGGRKFSRKDVYDVTMRMTISLIQTDYVARPTRTAQWNPADAIFDYISEEIYENASGDFL